MGAQELLDKLTKEQIIHLYTVPEKSLCLTDEETEAQKREMTCPRSFREAVSKLGLESRFIRFLVKWWFPLTVMAPGRHPNPLLPRPYPNTPPPHTHMLTASSSPLLTFCPGYSQRKSTAISGSLRTVQVTLKFSPSWTDVAEAWMVGLGEEDGSAMEKMGEQ